MTLFYSGAAALIILFILFLLIPFWSNAKKARKKENAISNPEIVKQRLSELEQERQEALFSSEDYDEAVIETKLSLADELDTASGVDTKSNSRALLYISITVFTAILASTAWVYSESHQLQKVQSWLLAQQKLPELGQRIVVQADEQISRQELVEFALALRTKLSRQQEDAVGWLLLGRVLSSLTDFEGAIDAFNKSIAIQPDRPGALFSLAQALLVTSDASNMAKAENILLRLRSMTPQDNNVMGLLAVTYARNNKPQEAINTWLALQKKLDQNDPMQSTIEEQLKILQGETATAEELNAESGTEILVTVSVDPILRDKIPIDGQLFVFVQDADSDNRMPAAVIKLPTQRLLASGSIVVSLSDANAMMPEFQLSSLNRGRLIARVSSDDMVTPSTGDLQGQSTVTINKGNSIEHAILIDKELL